MVNRLTLISINAAITVLLTSQSGALFAQDSTFTTTVKASSEGNLPDAACAQAFNQAREEAYLQFEESVFFEQPNLQLELIEQTQSRRKRDANTTICEVTSVWQSLEVAPVHQLIGTEQFISAQYSAQCIDEARARTCWNRLADQARRDLMSQLGQSHGNLSDIRAIYVDFEGRQRDQYQDGRYTTTADGNFYFDIVAANQTSDVNVIRSHSAPPTSNEQPNPPKEPLDTPKKPDSKFDVSLSYTWDGNDAADFDTTAISSGRFGIGVWADNRLGFVAFSGEDTVGIGKLSGEVTNSSLSYQTTGVGMGVRLWKHGDFALENHIYYVDAQPYTAALTNQCSNCTDRTFTSEDYVQTTVNLKTNSKGINLGWMLTWKWLDNTANVDKLSGGWFVEVLF
ncbi:hypothetical protein QWZ13_04760 [Reinekea marina]|uniref:Uncharacterized protein n=1 Tax=Reinekea marina TaxID=1310421 RepID=A0ABV7WSW6_9GAMM|nr:hypothetical protein [Reinekea marina]MDN3648217.1 hypothetical protein [Reinekea marina]